MMKVEGVVRELTITNWVNFLSACEGTHQGESALPDPRFPWSTNSEGTHQGESALPDPRFPWSTNSEGTHQGENAWLIIRLGFGQDPQVDTTNKVPMTAGVA
jgi:hypothetical protein